MALELYRRNLVSMEQRQAAIANPGRAKFHFLSIKPLNNREYNKLKAFQFAK